MSQHIPISLSPLQQEQLAAFERQLLQFNRRLNLISRETEAGFYERHVLHSLALANRRYPAGASIVDWGTGGGLPAIPLAIAFPDVQVHAVDSVGKKIQAVRAVARRLGLENLHAWNGRAEAWPGRAHFSVSRATAPLADLWQWHVRVRSPVEAATEDKTWRPGLICLKGGMLDSEIAAVQQHFPYVEVETTPLEPLLGAPYFAEKMIVEVYEKGE